MFRFLCLLWLMATLGARASEPIPLPYGGASATVERPQITAELIPETTLIEPGKPFDVILHLHATPGWHTYWINPGEAGLATQIQWTLPPGFTAGPIQWPAPENHSLGGIVTYGYEGDVYLITTITPSVAEGAAVIPIEIKARASWLVCQEACIPGRADLSLTLNLAEKNAALDYKHVENSKFFAAARERLPVPNTRWDVKARYTENSVTGPGIALIFDTRGDVNPFPEGTHIGSSTPEFFPEQPNILSGAAGNFQQSSGEFQIGMGLAQNGEKANKLSGVLVFDQPLMGTAKAVSIAEFAVEPLSKAEPEGEQGKAATAPSTVTTMATTESATAAPLLIVVLGAAFIGGLILNLMPCVLPVLSLKVFSLMRHAGDDPRGAWKQGAAFTAGVVVSFWALAGLLLLLRGVGNQLGWGFQMQSPGFVLGLTFLFFLLALNLFGVFEIGTSLVGLDVQATGKLRGLTSSFLNGALATLAATPCTGPFMGSSLGFAAQQPWYVALLIFTFLALGMASPYLLLTIFPGALKRVPKPGAWMEAFKQFMGFLLMLTVIWLVSVYGSLTGAAQVPWLLASLLLASMAAWIYGRWGAVRAGVFAVIVCGTCFLFHGGEDLKWEPWTPAAVEKALAEGRPVFVDFTADWCLSCKVNERVALQTAGVRRAFAEKNVVLLKADWTQADPEISKTLQRFNRDGVPLYLLYSPKNRNEPQVLPEVLTPGIVTEAVGKL